MGRKFFWQSLRLRTWDSEATTPNAVDELLFDLVFTACVGSLRYEVQEDLIFCSSENCDVAFHLVSFVLLFFPYWWNAYLLVNYVNKFSTEEQVCVLFLLPLLLACAAHCAHAIAVTRS